MRNPKYIALSGVIITLALAVGVWRVAASRHPSGKEQPVVVEYIRYQIPPAQHEAFLTAYRQATTELDAAPQCLAYEIAQGVEEPDNFIVRIEWTSIQDHERGFRTGPHFPSFFAKVKPYFDAIQEMKHYNIAVQRRRAAGSK